LPDKAIDLVDQECAMAMSVLFRSRRRNLARTKEAIGRDEVAGAVAERCKIPVSRLAGDERERLLHIEATLRPRERTIAGDWGGV